MIDKITKKSTIACVIILNLPFFFVSGFHLIAYRTAHTVVGGDFAQLDYFMNSFELCIMICGFFLGRYCKKIINLYPLLFCVLIKDAALTLLGHSSPFTWNSWEMYCAPLIAMGCIRIVGRKQDVSSFEYFMDALIICNFIYQFLFLMTGRVGDAGRVTVMNQGVGSVGMMCSYYVIYSLLLRHKDTGLYIKIAIAIVSMVLSGSRFSLLLVAVSIAVNFPIIFEGLSKRQKISILIVVSIIAGCLIAILSNSVLQNKYEIISRMAGLFENNNMAENINEDDSFLERLVSFTVGFEIIEDNCWGLTNSFIDVQTQTIYHGFFSFPHSTLMCYYLLWGPFVFYGIWWMIKKCMIAHKYGEIAIFRMLIIMLVCFAIYGGIETAPKVYSFIFSILCCANLRLSSRFSNQ